MLGEWTERGSVGTTAASKLLGLAMSDRDSLPEDSASLICISQMQICFGDIFRRANEQDGQADTFHQVS